jgi:mRNA interferase HigB
VQIVTRKHLEEAMETYKDAADELKKWRRTVKAARWSRFEEVKSIFTDADDVDDYVIFNIRGNRYRLVTVMHYVKVIKRRQTKGHVYIRSFLTHKEYDNPANWDRKYGRKKKK